MSRRLLWLAGGLAALAAGTLLGSTGGLLDSLARPPAILRAALVGGAVVVALALAREALGRIDAGRRVTVGEAGPRDVAVLIRGVRFVFLAVAAFSAAAGWLLGHPLPFVVALLIAGVDVVETTLLLLVATFRGDGAET